VHLMPFVEFLQNSEGANLSAPVRWMQETGADPEYLHRRSTLLGSGMACAAFVLDISDENPMINYPSVRQDG